MHYLSVRSCGFIQREWWCELEGGNRGSARGGKTILDSNIEYKNCSSSRVEPKNQSPSPSSVEDERKEGTRAHLKMPSSKKERRSGQDSIKMDDAGVGVAGREAEAEEPRDARVVRELLRSMGIGEGEYEPRVLHQFLELCYRYVVDVLSDSQVYAEHAGKNNIDPDDISLAIQSKVNFSFSQPPPREVLLELARTRNKTPLPKTIAPPGSIPLPPEQDTLVSPNYQLLIPRKQPAQIEEAEEDEDGPNLNPNPNSNSNPNSSVEQRTDAEQQAMQAIPQKVSFALASAAAPAAKRQRC